MVSLTLHHLSKNFLGHAAVDDLSLTVASGELFCLLGPSGCGKSTTLQMISGLVAPDSGQVSIDGVDITQTPVQRRNIGVVFQNFALFPHMTVAENVGYGLKARRASAAAIERKTAEMLSFVGLDSKRDRYPRNLSGGEQQRVALARALAIDPSLLLLDEPFSSLDRELRLELRTELSRVQRETKLTMVFVTHDQDEAFAIADTIAVCEGGRLQQSAAPRDLYNVPANPFVARFVGRSNLISGRLTTEGGKHRLSVGDVMLPLAAVPPNVGAEVTVLVRPENVVASGGRPMDGCAVEGTVRHIEYAGSGTLYHLSALGQTILASRPASRREEPLEVGARAFLRWDATDAYVIPEQE